MSAGPGRKTDRRRIALLSVRGTPNRTAGAAVTAGCYAALFLLGVMEGLIGCFQFSRSVGPVPVAALGFALAILATCLLAGWGMRSPIAALTPAAGWFFASFVLSLPTAGGSVIVTNTSAGKWYLYGGAACAGLGVVLSLRWRPLR